MSHDQETPILEHNHDGIQEYDNPLPSWWLWTFFGTIIFAFNYWVHYEFGGALTQKEELKLELSHIQSHKPHPPVAQESDADLHALLGQETVVTQGREVFAAKCAVCHGAELQGTIGPNLTDEFWIHGKGHLSEIAQIVRSGVTEKGMPAWEGQLKTEEIKAVVAFVFSKKDSHPANPKAPQGEKVEY